MTPSFQLENDEARLEALHRYQILDTEAEQSFDDVLQLATYICQAPMATITFVDRDRAWFKSAINFHMREVAREDSFSACTILKHTPLVVEDTFEDERFRGRRFVVGPEQIRFYAGAPLVTPDGFVIGCICVFDQRPRVLTEQQTTAMIALSRQVMSLMALRMEMAERARTAEALRLSEKLAAVGRMASSIAHEINNPLQSVTNLLFVADRLNREPELHVLLEEAQNETRRVAQTVTQTLQFHRQSVKAVPVRIGELIESTLVMYRRRLNKAQIQVKVKDRQNSSITLNASDFCQVLAHLLSNSIESMREGGQIQIKVRDATNPATGRTGVRLTFADCGEGMTAATIARMFDPFFTTQPATKTGLGLWVSKDILDKHEAQVRVRSSVSPGSSGTLFSIFVPHSRSTLQLVKPQ